MHCVNGAAARICSHSGEERGVRNTEANLLTLHISSGLIHRNALIDSVKQRARLRLSPITGEDAREPQHRHGAKDCPAMARRAGQLAKGHSQSRRDEEDREHLYKIAEWSWILERMRAVRIKEAASVGAQHLDGFL